MISIVVSGTHVDSLGGVVGGVVSLLLSLWSRRCVRSVDPVARFLWPIAAGQVLCGTFVGVVSMHRGSIDALFLCIVTALLIVQVPLDILTRRLGRIPTLAATVGTLFVSLFATYRDWTIGRILGTAATVVGAVAVFVTIRAFAPRSLGLGDVLLSLPLSVSIAFATEVGVTYWLLLASCSAVVHGAIMLNLRGHHFLPFGPHLIGAAWILLLVEA